VSFARLPQLSIIGLGLIGGSAALAARKADVADRIIAWDHDPGALSAALSTKLIDAAAESVAEASKGAAFVLIAAPVRAIPALVLEAARFCPAACAIADTGSVKAGIHQALKNAAPNFVGCHPLAGSEKSGHRHARANLFEGHTVVLTRGADSRPGAFEQVSAFWDKLGAKIVEMDALEHDRILARTSHLPHFVAAALTLVAGRDPDNLMGTGFRDTTRIAAGDATLWTDVALTNREAVLAAMCEYEREWRSFQSALERSDHHWIQQWLLQAKQRRDDLGN
jgi:prephenate dehydrogenase